jgi:quercetin dioxygenase-like cupin family protein
VKPPRREGGIPSAARRKFLLAAGIEALIPSALAGSISSQGFRVESGAARGAQRQLHGGQGLIEVKYFFEPERPSRPVLLIQYDVPPGASEGVHTHAPGSTEGAWDEYYYIVSGAGEMTIDGRALAVKAGDHIHAPLGTPHGIANRSGPDPLRVLLTAIDRG